MYFLHRKIVNFINILLKFVPRDQINIFPEMVQIMAWRLPSGKPLSEQLMINLLTRIYAPFGPNEFVKFKTKFKRLY